MVGSSGVDLGASGVDFVASVLISLCIFFDFLGFSLIFFDFLKFSLIFFDFLRFSSIFFDFLRFSSIFFDFHRFSSIFFDFLLIFVAHAMCDRFRIQNLQFHDILYSISQAHNLS